MKGIILGVILCLGMNVNAQTAKEFMVGTFKYCNDQGAIVVMKKNKAIETFEDAHGKKVVVKSKVKWLTDNKYEVTFVSVKGGNTPAKVGMVVICYIKEIKDGEATVSFTFDTGQKTAACFKKIK